MRRSKQILVTVIFLGMVGLATKARADFPFEYDWLTNNPLYSGKIFFDAPSNANGALTDIDLANSFITTPDGTFFFANGNFALGPTLTGTLSWDGSQILSMDIQGEELDVIVVTHWEVQPNSISDQPFLFDVIPGTLQSDTGSWVAAGAVPEPGTWIAAAAVAAVMLGHYFRRRSLQRLT